MGHFLTVSAFRCGSITHTMDALQEYLRMHGVTAESLHVRAPSSYRRDAQIYTPVGGWTVVLWPEYFHLHDFPVARAVARLRNWLVSTVHIYDDKYWEHLCLHGGTELHSFCSRPRFWKWRAPKQHKSVMCYQSEPHRLASALGVAVESLEPYLGDVDELPDPSAKARVEDEFALGNLWVFVDFWHRLGIAYPHPPHGLAAVLRLPPDFTRKLPTVGK